MGFLTPCVLQRTYLLKGWPTNFEDFPLPLQPMVNIKKDLALTGFVLSHGLPDQPPQEQSHLSRLPVKLMTVNLGTITSSGEAQKVSSLPQAS